MNEGNLDSNEPGTCARDNGGKAKFSLVPMHLLAGVARVLMHGEKKYKAWNWAKGGKWSQSFDCCMRHMLKFWYCRRDYDKESLLHEVDHAMCNLMFLRHNILSYPAGDDRPPAYTMMEGEVDWVDELFPNGSEEKSQQAVVDELFLSEKANESNGNWTDDRADHWPGDSPPPDGSVLISSKYWLSPDGVKYPVNQAREDEEDKIETYQYWVDSDGRKYPANPLASHFTIPPGLDGDKKCDEKVNGNNKDWTDAISEAPEETVEGQAFGVDYWITKDTSVGTCGSVSLPLQLSKPARVRVQWRDIPVGGTYYNWSKGGETCVKPKYEPKHELKPGARLVWVDSPAETTEAEITQETLR